MHIHKSQIAMPVTNIILHQNIRSDMCVKEKEILHGMMRGMHKLMAAYWAGFLKRSCHSLSRNSMYLRMRAHVMSFGMLDS